MKELNFNLAEFKDYISDKKCICFGAGLQGLHIIYLFENWGISENILAFADNNPQKWNTIYEVENYSYPIISADEIINFIDMDIVIIITCADVMGVKSQLNENEKLNNTVYFSLAEIAQMQLLVSDYEKVVHESSEPIIPKKIHYCWFGNEMPKSMRNNVEKWHELCPDYEFYEWNENNYDVRKVDYMSEAYDAKKWGFVPDYIRLDVIYNYGGIYLDTDVELLKKPDELLYQKCFAISDSSFFMALGAGFGATSNNPMIKVMRDYYNTIHFIRENGTFDITACMMHQYRVLRQYNVKLTDTLQNVGGINIYPMIMASTNSYSMQMKLSEKAFFAHYGANGWLGKQHKENKRKMQEKGVEGLVNYDLE